MGLDYPLQLGNIDGILREGVAVVANNKVEEGLDVRVRRGRQRRHPQNVEGARRRCLGCRLRLAHGGFEQASDVLHMSTNWPISGYFGAKVR